MNSISQRLTDAEKMGIDLKELQNFFPDAKAEDWELIDAGINEESGPLVLGQKGGHWEKWAEEALTSRNWSR